MAIPRRLTLSYFIDQNKKKIITPVNLYSIPYNASLTLSTDALWDTGASISAITPVIMNKLKVTPVDKKTIAGIHSTQIVDIVYITVELPNNVIKRNIEVAVCNIPSNVGMTRYGHNFTWRFCFKQRKFTDAFFLCRSSI